MPHVLAHWLSECGCIDDLHDVILARSLELTGAPLGNIQLMNWKSGYLTIAAQHGFHDPFLTVFRHVSARDGSACGRALRRGSTVVIEDVFKDADFAPFRDVALEARFSAVQSTPLISSRGAFVGIVSTHFDAPHRPLDGEMAELRLLGEAAANAILREQARSAFDGNGNAHREIMENSADAIASSYALLKRVTASERGEAMPFAAFPQPDLTSG
jgi:GAF domain-containing protein